jgi:hypothetical protein
MKKTYDWKITLNKFLTIFAQVLVVGVIVYLTENELLLIIIPVLRALENYLKHR